MTYPTGVITRQVSFGGASTVESGEPLKIQVTTVSSRSLIWRDTGYRLESLEHTLTTETSGEEVFFEVPVTDQNGWNDAETRQAIIVNPGESSHTYTSTLRVYDGQRMVRAYVIGPYPVANEPGVLDGDLISTEVDPIDGTLTVYIPGPTGDVTPQAQVLLEEAEDARDQAQVLLEEAEDARDQAEVFAAGTVTLQDTAVAQLITTPGSETQTQLNATIGAAQEVTESTLRAVWMSQPRAGTGFADVANAKAGELARFSGGVAISMPDFTDRTGWEREDLDYMDFTDGKMFSLWEPGGNVPSLEHVFAVGRGQTARVSARFTVPSTASGAKSALWAGIYVSGIAAPSTIGLTERIGVGVNEVNRPVILSALGQSSSDAQQSLTKLPAGTYTGTIVLDAECISLTLSNDDGSIEYRQRIDRDSLSGQGVDAGALRWISIINRDSRHLNGVSIDSVDAHVEATRTLAQAGTGHREHVWTLSDGTLGDDLRVDVPANYDPRIGAPAVMMFHGSGRSAEEIGNANTAALVRGLTDAGYIVVAPNMGGLAPWGNQGSIDRAVAAYAYLMQHYSVTKLGLLSASAGTLTALTALNRGLLPAASAVYGMYPVTNLAYQYQTNVGHKAAIEAEFGFTDPADFATATAGHDPMTLPPYGYGAVPMRFSVSPDDTTTVAAYNGELFAQTFRPHLLEASILVGSGAHGALSQTVASDVLDFMARSMR